jgi:hypothetical protein
MTDIELRGVFLCDRPLEDEGEITDPIVLADSILAQRRDELIEEVNRIANGTSGQIIRTRLPS